MLIKANPFFISFIFLAARSFAAIGLCGSTAPSILLDIKQNAAQRALPSIPAALYMDKRCEVVAARPDASALHEAAERTASHVA